jgi:hypothetical protein
MCCQSVLCSFSHFLKFEAIPKTMFSLPLNPLHPKDLKIYLLASSVYLCGWQTNRGAGKIYINWIPRCKCTTHWGIISKSETFCPTSKSVPNLINNFGWCFCNEFKNTTNRSYISQLAYSAITNVNRIWNKYVAFVKWNAFLLERFCNEFVTLQCKTNFCYGYSFTRGNVSVPDKSFQIVEHILKSNKTEKPFHFVSLLEWIIWRWSLITTQKRRKFKNTKIFNYLHK